MDATIAKVQDLITNAQSILADLQAMPTTPTAPTPTEVDVKNADGSSETFVPSSN